LHVVYHCYYGNRLKHCESDKLAAEETARKFMSLSVTIYSKNLSSQCNLTDQIDFIWFDLLCLTPLSAIFQLYRGNQF